MQGRKEGGPGGPRCETFRNSLLGQQGTYSRRERSHHLTAMRFTGLRTDTEWPSVHHHDIFTVAGFHQVVNPNTWLLHLRLCQVSAVYNLDSSLRLCFSQESEDLVHVALASSACIALGDVGWGRPLGSDKHLGAPGVTGTASQPHTSVCIAVLQHTPIHRLVIAPRPFPPEFSSPR